MIVETNFFSRARDSWNSTLVKRILKSGSMMVHTQCTQPWVSGWENEYIWGDEVRFVSTCVLFQCVWLNESLYYHHIRHVYYFLLVYCVKSGSSIRFIQIFHFLPFSAFSPSLSFFKKKEHTSEIPKKETFLWDTDIDIESFSRRRNVLQA